MHSYSIDEKRIKVLKLIGVSSFIVTIFLLKALNGFVDYINNLPYVTHIPYIPQIAAFGFIFVGFFYLFDRYLWKISIAGLKVSRIPYLKGNWKGKIKTSHEDGKEIDIKVNIKQTWSSIAISLKTSYSESKSEVASISLSESRLVYQYFNEPQYSSTETMHKHYGVTLLNFEGNNVLKGCYFTDRDRQTHGDIYLERAD